MPESGSSEFHKYVKPPIEVLVKFIRRFAQRLFVEKVKFATGLGLTVIAIVLKPRQPKAVAVYVVEVVGLAKTVDPVVEFNPVEGDQVKFVAPIADAVI